MTQPVELDVDAIMAKIRAEVSQQRPVPDPRGGDDYAGDRSAMSHVSLSRGNEASKLLPQQSGYTLEDFLQFHDEDFIRNAYRALLGREPDPEGAGRFLSQLRAGALAKVEILGRIRYSPEGRSNAVPVSGLWAPFAARTLRRVPVIGPIAATIQYLLRLPVIVRNVERLEAVVFMHERQLHRRADQLAGEAEAALNTLNERVRGSEDELRRIADDLTGLRARTSSESEALSARIEQTASVVELRIVQERLKDLAQRLDEEVVAREHLFGGRSDDRAFLDALVTRLGSVEQDKVPREELQAAVTRIDSAIAALEQAKFDRIADALTQAVAAATWPRADVQEIWKRLGALGEQLIARERDILDQERRLTTLLDQGRVRIPKTREDDVLSIADQEYPRVNDAYYLGFEDRFRGTRGDIKERLRVYLPRVRAVDAGTRGAPVIDIGCGRGEWLQLLGDEHLIARGVDSNRAMIDTCRALDLDVAEADAIEFLRALEAGSVGAITAFHVIEHLPFEQMLVLFSECWRALRPGGVAIFETPNPENLIVGACTFWYDPTHLRPLPPEPTRFALESRGFRDVEVVVLHAAHDAPIPDGSGTAFEKAVIARLYGAQDYALIGYRK